MRSLLLAACAISLVSGAAMAADSPAAPRDPAAALKDGRIGFVLTSRYWAVHESPGGKAECPNGFNDGPREQFKQLFPDDGV